MGLMPLNNIYRVTEITGDFNALSQQVVIS